MGGNYEDTLNGAPVYPDVSLYCNIFSGMPIWEGDGWKEESMSWKESCYVHSGLTGMGEISFKGPDAQKLLSTVAINDCEKWPVGTSKHLVMCNEYGLIVNHVLSVRDGEDSFRTFTGMPWAIFQNMTNLHYNVEITPGNPFILQIAGPLSLQVLEKVTGENLRDVGFLAYRPVNVPGIDAPIEVARIGMAGTLAYELRGPIEAGPAVYDLVYQAGAPLGMKRLGWRTYVVNHTEGGFPQLGCTFMPAMTDPAYRDFVGAAGMIPLSGSIDPTDFRARMRTPGEVGWSWMAKFNYDFIGRGAVEAEAANPKRTIVTLRWNPDDVLDTFASLLKPGEEYKTIEFPCGQQMPAGGHADHVTKDGKDIGVSSSTLYSYYYREVISHGTVDIDQAEIGNEVVVHWGDFGKKIKEVRATVARYPYLDLPRNDKYDLSTIPSGL